MRAIVTIFVVLAGLVAAGAGLGLASGGLGYRFDVWDLGTAFSITRNEMLVMAAMGGAGASALGFLVALVFGPRTLALPALAAALIAGAPLFFLDQMSAQFEANPFIHDVTTDFEDPPQIVAAAELERSNPPDYRGDEAVREGDKPTAELQREAFPDIKPAYYEVPPDMVFDAAMDVVATFGWAVLNADKQEGVIEAASTSLWFGFTDDVIIRVREHEGGARVDVRSKSRVGGSDLGANAARVRAFLSRLDEAVAAA